MENKTRICTGAFLNLLLRFHVFKKFEWHANKQMLQRAERVIEDEMKTKPSTRALWYFLEHFFNPLLFLDE